MTNRPAETGGAAVAILAALVTLFGIDLSDDQFAALVVLVGFIPGLITWFVSRRRAGVSDPMR